MRALVIKQRFTVFMVVSYSNFCFSVCSYILLMCQRSNVLEEKNYLRKILSMKIEIFSCS